MGATEYASASQKWNGTIAALARKPTVISVERPDHERVAPARARAPAPICAMFSAPVRA